MFFSYEKIKEVAIPTNVYSASLIKDNSIFVCGGDDLKLYKYNYETGTEIGKVYIHIREILLSYNIDKLSGFISNINHSCIFRKFQRTLWSRTLCPIFTRWWAICLRIRRWNTQIVANRSKSNYIYLNFNRGFTRLKYKTLYPTFC